MNLEHSFNICILIVMTSLIINRQAMGVKWPVNRIGRYSGEIMLGALFPIHEASSDYSNCGRIQLEDGIQPLEALIYTIKAINAKGIIPGVRLGMVALDSCDNVVHALDQSLDFIKGWVYKMDRGQMMIDCQNGTQVNVDNERRFSEVVGVIGGQSSQVSVQMANILRIFRVPQVSYLSTSSTLSDRHMFGYFFRTVPADINQVVTILKILKYFNWTYVSLVYTNTDYGNKGLEELEKLAPSYQVCFAAPQRININQFNDDDYDNVIRQLMYKSKAKVVIMFADKRTARQLMAAVKRQNAVGRFVWIGSDGWSGRHSVADGQEEVIEGAITVQPLWSHLAGFDEYLSGRRPDGSADADAENPWFDEFWQEYFRCRLDGGRATPFSEHYDACPPDLTISADRGYKQQTYLHFVRDAAYAFAHAIGDLHRDRCRSVPGLCPEMRQYLQDNDLKPYLENVTFRDELGRRFRFQQNGDGPPRYSILNYQKLPDGMYAWVQVGNYLSEDDDPPPLPAINRTDMKFFGGNGSHPSSYCSEPCLEGQAKIQQESCCWLCTNCSTYQYLSSEQLCEDCPLGTLPNTGKTSCEAVAVHHIDYDNPWAVVSMMVATVGLLVTLTTSLLFRVHSDTPIIKAAGRELSYVLLSGILLSYVMTFALVSKPTPLICGVQRFFVGFCYTLCYAAIATKTNRIARIFKAKYDVHQKTRFISPRSQMVITAGLVSIEVIINGTCLLVHPPATEHVFPTRDEGVLICAGSDDVWHLIGLVYPFLLIGSCTVYAFKTRKCPEGFNETRFVAFTNYTTCVLWFSFLPLYFSSASVVTRTITISLSLSMAATVQLGCLFVPKIYRILLKPEKNTKEVVMSQHHHHNNHHVHNRCNMMKDAAPSSSVNISSPPLSCTWNGVESGECTSIDRQKETDNANHKCADMSLRPP